MLIRLLKTMGLGTRTPASVQTRFDMRTGLYSYDQVLGQPSPLSNGDPVYYVHPEWFLENSYLVTDPAAVRIGDILVGHEGSQFTTANIRGKTIVVTINRATRQAVYTRWAQMSLNPADYHVRRLVVSTSGTDSSGPVPKDVGFLKYTPQLAYDSVRYDPDGFKQWTPNTGELGYLGKITLRSTDGQDLANLVDGSSWEVRTVSDYGWKKDDPNGNVFNNTPSTVFHLVALKSPHQEDGIAVTLERQTPVVQGNGDGQYLDLSRYVNNNDGTYHNEKDQLLDGTTWELVVEHRSLAVKNRKTGELFPYFAVYAENPVPGDDITIGFTIHSPLNDDLQTASGSLPRLAVYDKKLLWRANLYVDKDGPSDWNNLHPWLGSANQPNEWNHGQGGEKEGQGGQTQLQQFTTIGPGSAVGRYIPYDYPRKKDGTDALGTATDSPFAYNRKMLQLKDWQNTKYRINGELRNNNSQPNDIWNRTVAPNSLWEGYFNSQNVLNTTLLSAFNSSSSLALPQVGLFYFLYDFFRDSDHLDKRLRDELKIQTQDGVSVSLGLYLRYNQNGNDFSPWHIGTDCIGFAQRVASYANNPYFWPDFSDDTLADIGDGNTKRSYPNGKDAQGNSYSVSVATRNNNAGLKFLIPGDVVTYDTPGHPNSHIAVVQNITPEPDGSVLPGDVSLIEAYFQGESSWVGIDRTLQGWQNPGQTWFADRLTFKDQNP